MDNKTKKIKVLQAYFTQREDILFAFVFGSQAKNKAAKLSDWDIAVYLKSDSFEIEMEKERNYPNEDKIWGDIIEILETDNVDLIVLNRAPANIAASAIGGLPLVIKDRRLYLEFMLRITGEANDYRQTESEYAQVYWRSSSLSPEDKSVLSRRLVFLDSELQDADKFQGLTRLEYEKDSMKRRQVERWIENLMNAAIDVSKIILASSKKAIPSTYREILRTMGTTSDFPQDVAEQLAHWVELRNILAHEYLDIRWRRIEDFVKKSEPVLKKFIASIKKIYD